MEQRIMSNFTEKELIYLCQQYANMFGFPVRLYKNGELIFSCSVINMSVDPITLCIDKIMQENLEVSYFVDKEFLYYGIVNHNEYKFIVGPVIESKVPDNELRNLGFMLKIPNNEIAYFISDMKTLFGTHLDTVIQAVILFNFSVNRTMYDISDIRIKKTEQKNITSNIKDEEIKYNAYLGFYENRGRSFAIEKDIIKKVMNGDVEGLIEGANKIPSVSSGNLAPHLVRHQKNFFIKLETIVSRAAIDAGLDIDEVFSIEEMYIVKCESLNNIDRIKNLQYHMILDYASRINKLHKYNEGNSKLVSEITNYIKNHISEPIKTSDISEHFGKSRGGITTEFKKQTGMNLSDFIKLKKIQEAESLLCETDRSLSEISYYLGFSSQGHFCKVFKEINGLTPTEYRNKM